MAAIALVVGIGQVSGSPARAAVLSASARAGADPQTATYYATRGMGNCSYPSPPADGLYVALSPPEYAKAARCGGYLEVSGPAGSVLVKVIDQCPGCAAGHIDLSETAFARLAPLSAGRIKVTYTYQADPPLPGPLSIEVNHGSSRYWLALLADNTGNPLALVQVRTASGWLSLTRASYNCWIASSGAARAVHGAPDRHTGAPGDGARDHAASRGRADDGKLDVRPARARPGPPARRARRGDCYLPLGRCPGSVRAACRCAGQERGGQSGSVTRGRPRVTGARCA